MVKNNSYVKAALLIVANILGTGIMYVIPSLMQEYSLQEILANLMWGSIAMLLVTSVFVLLIWNSEKVIWADMISDSVGVKCATFFRMYYIAAIFLTLRLMRSFAYKVLTNNFAPSVTNIFSVMLAVCIWLICVGCIDYPVRVLKITGVINMFLKFGFFSVIGSLLVYAAFSPVGAIHSTSIAKGWSYLVPIGFLQCTWFFILSGAETCFSYTKIFTKRSLVIAVPLAILITSSVYFALTILVHIQPLLTQIQHNGFNVLTSDRPLLKNIVAILECTALTATFLSWLAASSLLILRKEGCVCEGMEHSALLRNSAWAIFCVMLYLSPRVFAFSTQILGFLFMISFLPSMHAAAKGVLEYPQKVKWLSMIIICAALIYVWLIMALGLQNSTCVTYLDYITIIPGIIYTLFAIYDVTKDIINNQK